MTCSKRAYTSFRTAQGVINAATKGHKRNRRLGRHDKIPRRSYKCELCGFWHITSKKSYNKPNNEIFIKTLIVHIESLYLELKVLRNKISVLENCKTKSRENDYEEITTTKFKFGRKSD